MQGNLDAGGGELASNTNPLIRKLESLARLSDDDKAVKQR